ncbi:hypothetical protein GGI43DRAFT_402156 [Trichoderma evansii]
MGIKIPWHHNSSPPPAFEGDTYLLENDCEYIFGTWKAQAGKARAHRGHNQQISHNVEKIGIKAPIISSPPDRALWPKATYSPHSPHSAPIPIQSSPDSSCLPTQSCISPSQIHSASLPVCFLCSGYLGDKHGYTLCSACETKYTMPPCCFSEEYEYEDFFPTSPSLQGEDSDTPIRLADECISEWKKSCLINDANSHATLALSSQSSVCSQDASDSCPTPALSCSSSVYSQDEFDVDKYLELIGTENSLMESRLTGSANSCATPELSSSSSVYSQDEPEEEGAEKDTRGYYELPWVADYFNEHQHSIYKELEENVEEDCSIEIDIHYR